MTGEETIRYLANVALIAAADGSLKALEAQAIEQVREELGASKKELHEALQKVAKGDYAVEAVGRYSEKIKNLEDMILVALADRNLSPAERPEILSFARKLHLNQEQLRILLSETKQRLASRPLPPHCPACGTAVPPGSKFCPGCGNPVSAMR